VGEFDFAWGIIGWLGGQYLSIGFGELPFVGKNRGFLDAAHWVGYKKL
jgi:hypothetical protein